MNHEQPDEPLVLQWMGYSKTVLERWHREGLPEGISPEEYFGVSKLSVLPVTVHPYPVRQDIVVEKSDTHRVIVDNRDRKLRFFESAPHGVPEFLESPVKCRDDWERYRERINPGCDARFEELREKHGQLKDNGLPLCLCLRGCWEIRYFLGLTEALYMLHDDPEFIKEMLDFWFQHQWEILDRVCEIVVPDLVAMWEDIAYKTGPFFSPEMYERYFAGYHRGTAERLKAHGIRHFLIDCDGNIDVLLPLFMDNGITGVFPLECQAGSDPVKYRALYGKDVQFVGGIDKRALYDGKEPVRREVDRKISALASEAGFLPSLDHAVPLEVSLDTFGFYVDYLRETWRKYLT
jgi:uroporphyrinogen decarboxylase